MIVITRKKLISIVSCISMILCIGIIPLIPKKAPIKETVSLPVTNKTIVIDAGHGIPDERCRK